MGRIRTIKPEFHSHEELSALPAETHLLAAALVNYADDYGYFNANPLLVKAGTNPLRQDALSIVEQLAQLEGIGYIVIRREGLKCYGIITTFGTHQKVSHPTESKIKAKFEALPKFSGEPQDTFRPEQGTGNREQGREAGAVIPKDEPQPTPEDIVCAHPASVSRNLQPLQVTHAQSSAVVDVLAAGESPGALLAKVRAIAAVVAEWPPGEMKFLSRTDRFFREREFNKPLEEWRYGANRQGSGGGSTVKAAATQRSDESRANIRAGFEFLRGGRARNADDANGGAVSEPNASPRNARDVRGSVGGDSSTLRDEGFRGCTIEGNSS